MSGLSPGWIVGTALGIPGLALLLMILQYRPAEILNLFRVSRAGPPQARYIALAALRKYLIVSGLMVFVGKIFNVFGHLTHTEQISSGLAAATGAMGIALLFAYPICGIWMRRLEKIYRLPTYSFRVGFGNDRVTWYLLATIGMVLILIVTITVMLDLTIWF